MIAKAKTGSGFAGLARYLQEGGPPGGRVAWCETRHLPDQDPQLAARMMRATANRNERIEKPVYHLSISFDSQDQATPALMRQVAEQTLSDLGLANHQALLIAHDDRAHPHLHIMVNRVDPETGAAWNNGHDFARLERSLRQQERGLGLREVPGHHYRLEGQRAPDRTGPTTGQLRQADRSGQVPFDERVRATAGPDFREAKSWPDLTRRLRRHGLHLEKRGRGLVVSDGRNRVKGSSLARDASLAALEKRFGPFRHEITGPERDTPRAPPSSSLSALPDKTAPASPDRVAAAERSLQSLVAAFRDSEELSSSLAAARSEVATAAAVLRDIRRQVDGRDQDSAFDAALRRVYRDPAEARRLFDELAARQDPQQLLDGLRENPASLGRLRGRSILGFSDAERAEAVRGVAPLTDRAEAVMTCRRDSAAAFLRLQPATQRHLAAIAARDQLEARRRDTPSLPAEQVRAGLRSLTRTLGPEASNRLSVTVARDHGRRYGLEIQMAAQDVFRSRETGREGPGQDRTSQDKTGRAGPDKDRDPDLGL